MNIAIKNSLTKSEISEILLLQDICNFVDKTHAKPKLSTDLNVNKAIPTFFLGREDDILVAFLTVFIPEGGIPDVTAFVHPSYRRQRRFSEMFGVLKNLYKGYGYNSFIFPVNSLSLDGNKAADNFKGLELHHRDYIMELDTYVNRINENPLEIKEVTPELIAELSDAIRECSDSYLLINSFKNGIGSPDRTSYVAFMYDKPVGFFSVYHNEESEEFYGVSIRKPLRSKGLGKMMLSAAVKKVLEKGMPIIAHVDSENPAAYHIYTTLGFMRTERNDYYIYKN